MSNVRRRPSPFEINLMKEALKVSRSVQQLTCPEPTKRITQTRHYFSSSFFLVIFFYQGLWPQEPSIITLQRTKLFSHKWAVQYIPHTFFPQVFLYKIFFNNKIFDHFIIYTQTLKSFLTIKSIPRKWCCHCAGIDKI